MDQAEEHFEIVIVGAGLAGIGMAIALKEDGREDFVILERAADLGGTWRDNSYPGCACDIPSVLYSYSSEQNPRWSRAFARQPEIWAYMHDVARRHELGPHSASESRAQGGELVRAGPAVADRDRAGHHERRRSSSPPPAPWPTRPSRPCPASSASRGRVFHSARWDHAHDLRGRRSRSSARGPRRFSSCPRSSPRWATCTCSSARLRGSCPGRTRASPSAGGPGSPAIPGCSDGPGPACSHCSSPSISAFAIPPSCAWPSAAPAATSPARCPTRSCGPG